MSSVHIQRDADNKARFSYNLTKGFDTHRSELEKISTDWNNFSEATAKKFFGWIQPKGNTELLKMADTDAKDVESAVKAFKSKIQIVYNLYKEKEDDQSMVLQRTCELVISEVSKAVLSYFNDESRNDSGKDALRTLYIMQDLRHDESARSLISESLVKSTREAYTARGGGRTAKVIKGSFDLEDLEGPVIKPPATMESAMSKWNAALRHRDAKVSGVLIVDGSSGSATTATTAPNEHINRIKSQLRQSSAKNSEAETERLTAMLRNSSK